ncbi:3-hydroxyacyl-ACP dehydratase FabZ family protein [Stieleria varia]|uniref:3-hydroxyacyl-[acyl-carrier-protein] dehydratase FabZ n=1 Tax=Stieleria varia TaxID=2528005 RepID=A0A5C6B3X9_9BACT|nr:hypothetical protein [Stieleria varia]TWU06457.1 3-hydroxyacyl-[acyl-carrier-protein] dehydratase FabZ [Stieleria varia]
MRYFHHDFDSIEGYLHHRRPYLLVDEILSLDDATVVTQTTVPSEAIFIHGHFPGAPIFPGAMMQEFSTQSAGILIAARHNPMEQFDTTDPMFNEFALGVLVRIKNARYRGFARPGDVLIATVTLAEIVDTVFEFSAVIRCDDKVIMRNRFQLTNIPSSTLQGQ